MFSWGVLRAEATFLSGEVLLGGCGLSGDGWGGDEERHLVREKYLAGVSGRDKDEIGGVVDDHGDGR